MNHPYQGSPTVVITGLDNGLTPICHQAIIETNTKLLVT